MPIDENENLIPSDEDENVGGDPPKKKKEKKRKSKEELKADRRIIFWVMMAVFLITIAFYLFPIIKNKGLNGIDLGIKKGQIQEQQKSNLPEWKGYTEVKF